MELYAVVGHLKMELDRQKKTMTLPLEEKLRMVGPAQPSIPRRCALLHPYNPAGTIGLWGRRPSTCS